MRPVHTLFLFLVAFFVSVGSLKADGPKPNPPTNFNATFAQNQGTTNFNVTLTWNGSTYDDSTKRAVGYHIYMADTATEDMSLFSLIATVTQAYQGNVFRYIAEHLSAGTYTFFVRAFNNNGESDRTPIKVVKLVVSNTTNSLHITTSPGTTVSKGGSYRYEARANDSDSSLNSHIRYKIISGPDGMTIDSITGNISWTAPNENKTVTVKILAYLDNDDSQKSDQSWTITVGDNNNGGGDGCAYFVGNVRDTSGHTMNGTVKIYRIDSTGKLLDGVYTVTLVNGHWSRRVPPGLYVIRTQGDGFEYQWFDHAKEPSQAKIFSVACGDTNEVNFNVVPLAQEVHYVFHGRVTDAQSGNGVHATVYFYPVINGTLGTPITVQTNGDGNYEVSLSNRYSYIAEAIGSNDFDPLWFDNVASSTQATVLVANENKNNINFALPRRQSYDNGFSGQLVDSAGNGIKGHVIAFVIVSHNNDKSIQRIRAVETDSNGHFTLNNLNPGDYVLQGVPNSRPFVPGYYKLNEYAVFKWANGTTLTIDSTTHTNSLMIKLHAGEGRRGIIKLKGHCDGDGGITAGNDNHIQSLAPLAGALVVVLDNNNVPVDYAFTGADGNYEINDLALGANTLIVDHPSYVNSTQALNFSGQAYTVANSVTLKSVTSSVAEEAVSNGLVIPNPASNAVQFRFESGEGLANISILNSLGMEVAASSQSLVNGQNTVVLDASVFNPGTYFLRISMGNKVSAVKFSVIR